jgi:hypothetical protein
LLKLSGIWRQANSTLAVLNNRVIHEGENILGFTVQTVEGDRVWVQARTVANPLSLATLFLMMRKSPRAQNERIGAE